MARRGNKSTAAIQRLLEERRKVEQWLHRLRMAADKTPRDVRERVQGDYEARLDKVVGELQQYAGDIRSSLKTQRAAYADFKSREDAASAELAEAELRHAVGEYAESDWREKKAEILETLVKIREGLGEAEAEIRELDSVLQELEAPTPAPAPIQEDLEAELEPEELEEPEPRPARAADRDDRLSLGAELGLRDLGPKRAREELEEEEEEEAQTEAFGDELAFLKSVTEDNRHGPEATRASGQVRAISDDDLGKAERSRRGSPVDAGDIEKLSDQRSVGASRPSTVNQRTLKCGECGAMNLPTEWYCDRCGAELAGL